MYQERAKLRRDQCLLYPRCNCVSAVHGERQLFDVTSMGLIELFLSELRFPGIDVSLRRRVKEGEMLAPQLYSRNARWNFYRLFCRHFISSDETGFIWGSFQLRKQQQKPILFSCFFWFHFSCRIDHSFFGGFVFRDRSTLPIRT